MILSGAARAMGLIVVAALGLTGCGVAGPPATPHSPPLSEHGLTIDERFTPDIPAALRVRKPKDARGIDPCDLLNRDQLSSFGLDPDTSRSNPARYGLGCIWKHRDGSTNAGLGLSTDPDGFKLPDSYRLRDTTENFEILQIAGHPAIRADDVPTGECQLALAVADEQIVSIDAYLDGRILPDPCAPARRMAELIIANLATRP